MKKLVAKSSLDIEASMGSPTMDSLERPPKRSKKVQKPVLPTVNSPTPGNLPTTTLPMHQQQAPVSPAQLPQQYTPQQNSNPVPYQMYHQPNETVLTPTRPVLPGFQF